jgi:aryl-alcohol dehydrogenase-like predicted oxidoreductase
MPMKLGRTDLDVFELCLGGNVFGWTADEQRSFAVLDAYAAAGGNFVDTADGYSRWVPGHEGGESEAIIGRWMAARGNRDAIVVATKVGAEGGLGAANVRRRVEASLRRLQTDHVELLYQHRDDPDTPLEASLGTFDALVREGKARYVGLSNHAPARIDAAMAVAAREGFAAPVVLQPQYNLVERGYEDGLRAAAQRGGLACLPYYGLARGFLTGKYRPGAAPADSPRAQAASAYLDGRGAEVLAVVDEVAAAHGTTVAAVALAWLAAQPTVVAPIASARSTEQLAELLPMAGLRLSDGELATLDAVSR